MAEYSPATLATQMIFPPAVNSLACPSVGRSDLEAILVRAIPMKIHVVETVLSTGAPKHAPVLHILGWRTVSAPNREPSLSARSQRRRRIGRQLFPRAVGALNFQLIEQQRGRHNSAGKWIRAVVDI